METNDIQPDTNVNTQQNEELNKEPKKKKRNFIFNIISLLLILVAMVWGINLFILYQKYEITNDATIEQYIVPINSRVTGYIKKIYFTEHQWVNEGDTLVVIDDREFKIKLMDAQAAHMDAQNSASVLSSTISTTSSNVAVSEANIEEAKAKLWKLGEDLKRYKNLLDSEAVSRQQYEQVKSDYEAQYAHYNALLKQRESMKSTLTETSKKKGNIEATILRREADLALAKLNLSYTVITAPYSGYVGRRTLESGQLIQTGQTITNLINENSKWIIANYLEKQIENIHLGQEVKIRVDAIKERTFKGRVVAISEATGSKYSMLPTDNSAGNFVKIQQRIPVRINFEDISKEDFEKLRAGMMVTAEAIKE
jgi:membrane fusion protein (multidrug efflux system)